MYSVAELEEIAKKRLSKKRYTHSLNVAASAKILAELNGYDTEKAYIAGVLHDICKEIPHEQQLEMVKKSDRDICTAELVIPALFHAPAGAYYSEHVLGIHDEDILNAIRYHTIGRGGMTLPEKIVYLADLISADRTYKNVEKMRKICYMDLDNGMLEALKFSITSVVEKCSGLPIHTVNAYNEYAGRLRKE
ncbi:MAG: bis(5'-nucleosyl)-tetraphosphatase (symmetrical) YqeK [Oscillospiraceae bacterium]|nr:bis(5'-nucleosyl)-tetraphosphatase (symmetrical) YqeK [Oscillospiraceae bacterium]